MEYYDYNSNQQEMQDNHNQKELYKIKYFLSKSKDISLYINNVLINFNTNCHYYSSNKKICISNLRLLDNEFIQELKYNFKEKHLGYIDCHYEFQYKINYFSKLLNKEINHCSNFSTTYPHLNTNNSDYLKTRKIGFLIDVFRKEIFSDILLFLYENTDFIIKYISDDQTSFDYNEEIDKHNIKSLSEKRRMKTIIENF